jgi:hypothetical protein
MRRLSETDLANIGALPLSERRDALWRLNLKRPPVNYQPARRREPDIFNGLGDLLGKAREADLTLIEDRIRRDPATRNDATEKANLEVARCLHEYAVKHRIRARRYHFLPFVLPGAAGIKLVYWSPLVLVIDERLHVLFIDPRREHGLTPEGRHFAFSMMHHRVREVHLELEEAELLIFQLPMDDRKERCLVDHVASSLDRPLFDYDELETRVRETYSLWRLVLAEREAELRRRADRDRGDFGLSAS